MKVEVKLFAAAKQLAGAESMEVELPDGATIAQLRRAICELHPPLADLQRRAMFAIDADYARDENVIPPGAEIALIPPVSGGC